MTNLYVFGDSHVGALRDAAPLLARELAEHGLTPDFYVRTCANWIDFETTEIDGTLHLFCDIVPTDRSVDYRIEHPAGVYVFSSPLFSGLTYIQSTWRQGCPWQCAGSNPDLSAISTSVIESYLANQLQRRFDLLLRLKARNYRIAVIEAPRPLLRTPSLFGIRPDVLSAVDMIHRRYAADCLRRHDIEIISAPDDTHADGFTVDEYAIDDPTDTHHGNRQFGARMMQQVIQFAQNELLA